MINMCKHYDMLLINSISSRRVCRDWIDEWGVIKVECMKGLRNSTLSFTISKCFSTSTQKNYKIGNFFLMEIQFTISHVFEAPTLLSFSEGEKRFFFFQWRHSRQKWSKNNILKKIMFVKQQQQKNRLEIIHSGKIVERRITNPEKLLPVLSHITQCSSIKTFCLFLSLSSYGLKFSLLFFAANAFLYFSKEFSKFDGNKISRVANWSIKFRYINETIYELFATQKPTKDRKLINNWNGELTFWSH